jgi:hypothetical protein
MNGTGGQLLASWNERYANVFNALYEDEAGSW